MKIRKASVFDVEALQQIGKQTFIETFSDFNTHENMSKYLNLAFSTEKILEELRNIYSEFYFAISGESIVGYLKINLENSQTEKKLDKSLEIERIYVLNSFQRKEVGQNLFNKAIEIAKDKSLNYVWLGVWEQNLKAIRFYEKNGFKTFDKHIFKLGNDEQIDLMMMLALQES
jgi:ribosomal protein S18 acetylase RimI-like enzyme